MCGKGFILALLGIVCVFNNVNARTLDSSVNLRVVTILQKPYVEWKDGGYQGFLIDLMNELCKKINVEYSLYLSPRGWYGTYNGTHWNGMVGELIAGRADLALADLTITDRRKEVVDFSNPFLNLHLGGILPKSATTITTLTELGQQTALPYGTLLGGSTHAFFRESQIPEVQAMYQYIATNPNSTVRAYGLGIELARRGNYCLLGESLAFEYIAARECSLKTIGGWESISARGYGIGLQKNSDLLAPINQALGNLETSGFIKELYKKWWTTTCTE